MRSNRYWRRSILVVALLGSRFGAGAVAGTLIESTVAFVNKKPVLLSDVELTKALLRIEESAALERTIDECLMFDEASRLSSESPTEETIAGAVLALREKAGVAFTPAALRRKALVQLAISKHIDLRLRPLVRVEDAEVRKVFNEKVATDPQAPVFSLVSESIRESLERRALDQRIEEWVASLRRQEGVRRPSPRPHQ